MTKDPLHISSWSRVTSCKLTNISNSKLNKVKHVFDALLLNSSHPTTTEVHDEFGLLGSRVRDGESKWGSSFKVLGESFFIEGYWEWVVEVLGRHGPFLKGCKLYEAIFASLFRYDRHASMIRAFCECWCPATNFLHTSIGEVSISLWDLYRIARLPISGSFYDKMIPSAEELSNDATKSSLPPICRNLFLTYHRICSETKGKSSVKLASWVSFWYKGFMKYAKPPKKSTRNKVQRPKETHNPCGEIDPPKSRTQSETEIFDNLGIAETDVKETYLAVFLAC